MTLRLLEQVRDQLKACNAVRSERKFCEQWLGKSECYMRSLRFNHITRTGLVCSVHSEPSVWMQLKHEHSTNGEMGLQRHDLCAAKSWAFGGAMGFPNQLSYYCAELSKGQVLCEK